MVPPDDAGRILLACRAVLVDDGSRKILLETGIGAFFEPKLKARYGVVEDRHVLLDSLAVVGLRHSDIDVVVLSHLHFDHAGGLFAVYEPGRPRELLFPNASIVVGRQAFERARHPHRRDRASFVPGLTELLEASGRLVLVETGAARTDVLGDHFRFTETDGHTPGLLHTTVLGARRRLFYCSDLVPGIPWVHAPITMGFDRFPERLVDEKMEILDGLVQDDALLAYVHDPSVAFGRVERDENGDFRGTGPRSDDVGWLDLDGE